MRSIHIKLQERIGRVQGNLKFPHARTKINRNRLGSIVNNGVKLAEDLVTNIALLSKMCSYDLFKDTKWQSQRR